MKKALIAAVFALPLATSTAFAQERAGSAALGALSGAVVLGPIGAVAGAVVGYTAGPSIARSWGMKHSARRDQKRPAGPSRGASKQTAQTTTSPGQNRVAQNAPTERAPAPVVKPAAPPVQAVTPPPVQGFE